MKCCKCSWPDHTQDTYKQLVLQSTSKEWVRKWLQQSGIPLQYTPICWMLCQLSADGQYFMLKSAISRHKGQLFTLGYHNVFTVLLHVCCTITILRACLDQLLVAIRSLFIVCDHVRSKTRLIMIIAKLRITYTLGRTTAF